MLLRKDVRVTTEDGIGIAVRQVMAEEGTAGAGPSGTPLVMLHGTRIPGLSEFDLPVPGGSLAADMALRGHPAFVPDARGFGRSDRPAEMSLPPQESRPLVRCVEIVRDIAATVNHAREVTGKPRVALLGWGVGATVILMYAALWPEHVSHLILYNPLYGGGDSHPRYRDHPLEDPDRPGRFNAAGYGGYNYNDPDMLMRKWDASIPVADKSSWRDPAVAAAFRQALLDGDPTSLDRDPPTYRSPNGMLVDSFHMGRGEKLVHASLVQAAVLIIRPGLDYFSRPEDVAALQGDLVNAADVQLWEPPGATHYVLLDRPERGRDAAIARISEFLRS